MWRGLKCCFSRSQHALADQAAAEDKNTGASEEAGLAPVRLQGVALSPVLETTEDRTTGASEEAGLAPVQDMSPSPVAQIAGGASEDCPVRTSQASNRPMEAEKREEVCTSRKANGSPEEDTIEDRPVRTSRMSTRNSLRSSEDTNHVLGRLEQLEDERQGLRQQLQRLQASQIMEEADLGSVRVSFAGACAQPRFSQMSGRNRDSSVTPASPATPATPATPASGSSPTSTSSSGWRGVSARMSVAASFRLADVPEEQQREHADDVRCYAEMIKRSRHVQCTCYAHAHAMHMLR